MISLIAKTNTCYRDFGFRETARRILRRLGLTTEARLDVFALELKTADRHEPSKGVQEIFLDDLDTLVFARDLPPKSWLAPHFEKKSRLFGFINQDHVVAFEWVNDRQADLSYLGKPCIKLGAGVVYFYGVIVSGQYRRQGIGSRLKQTVIRRMAEEGKRLAVLTTYHSVSVSRWHRVNGFVKWGEICYVHRGDKETWRIELTSWGREHPGIFHNMYEDPKKVAREN